MNKIMKILLAILGAVSVVFNMFMPIAVALMSIKFFGFNGIYSILLLMFGICSSLYKAINVGFLRQDE